MPRTLRTAVFHVSRQTRMLCLLVSVVSCLALICAGGERAGAAGGDLDTTFNPGGAGGNSTVYAIALQPDGKIIIGGAFSDYNGSAAAPDRVARLNANGTLDASFNPGGAGADGPVNAVAVQADGKILIGGVFSSYNGDAAASDGIARLNANGTLDTSFNAGGAGVDVDVSAVALQADGKILIGGSFTSYNGDAAVSDRIARLNTDGTLDASFNPGGAGADNTVRAVAAQADGKIIIGGSFTSYNSNGAASDNILRLSANGTLDTSFNPGGAGADGDVFALALQLDGKIIIGGAFENYNGAHSDCVARLNSNGKLDTTFDAGATVAVDSVGAVAVQPGGKIIIGGGVAADGVVARLNTDGTLDTSFNSGGAVMNDYVHAVALQADGKILIGGDFTSYNGDGAAPDSVARLLPAPGAIAFSSANYGIAETAANTLITLTRTGGTDNRVVAKVTLANVTTAAADYRFTPGALDPTFNPGGSGANSTVYAMAVQPDGKIIIAGHFVTYNGDDSLFNNFVMRLNSNGTTDTTFNPFITGPNQMVLAVAVQPGGKIIIGGHFDSYNGDTAAPNFVMRLNANGTRDTMFNPGGVGASSVVNAVAVQPDGKIIIGGHFNGYNDDAAGPNGVARLNSDGTLDTSFNYGGAGASNVVSTVAVQADGKILVGGSFTAYNGDAGASDNIVRLNTNGTLDTSFNPGGAGANSTVFAVAVQPDGKAVIGGVFTAYNGDAAASDHVMRLNTNGTRDTTFNPGGAGANGIVYALAVQPDGKAIIGGLFTDYNGDAAASDNVARLNMNGTRDATFNAGGSGTDAQVNAAAVQADGKILIGGDFISYNGLDSSDKITRLSGDLFFTWPAGDDSNKFFRLPLVDDIIYEGNETLNLNLSILAGGATLGAPASSALTIVDNETPPKLSINNVTVTEGNSGVLNAAFTVTLSSGANSRPVTVKYHTVDGTATAPADYTAVPLTTLTFAPGQTSKTVNVAVKADLIDELDESFKVVLSNPTNAVIGTGTALGAGVGGIVDNDTSAVTVTNAAVTEPDGGTIGMVFTVKLSVANSRNVTVKYQTADGTATAPADYTARALTTLTFSPGETSKTVTVLVKGETLKEPNETFFVNLSSPVNATIADSQGQGTILNED